MNQMKVQKPQKEVKVQKVQMNLDQKVQAKVVTKMIVKKKNLKNQKNQKKKMITSWLTNQFQDLPISSYSIDE